MSEITPGSTSQIWKMMRSLQINTPLQAVPGLDSYQGSCLWHADRNSSVSESSRLLPRAVLKKNNSKECSDFPAEKVMKRLPSTLHHECSRPSAKSRPTQVIRLRRVTALTNGPGCDAAEMDHRPNPAAIRIQSRSAPRRTPDPADHVNHSHRTIDPIPIQKTKPRRQKSTGLFIPTHLAGLEPATFGFVDRRSIQLSYRCSTAGQRDALAAGRPAKGADNTNNISTTQPHQHTSISTHTLQHNNTRHNHPIPRPDHRRTQPTLHTIPHRVTRPAAHRIRTHPSPSTTTVLQSSNSSEPLTTLPQIVRRISNR